MPTTIKQKILSYDCATPRYTSYPPATQFESDFSPTQYEKALELIPADASISLYVHIPFCAKLCYYCGCFTTITKHADRVQGYLDTLLYEAKHVAEKLPEGVRVTHIHYGGGSPTLLSAQQFTHFSTDLMALFHGDSKPEIAIEADPRQLTEAKVAAYAKAGINRISLGVQDFNARTLMSVNREQPFALTWQAVEWCREYGIVNINMDLMYGLPYQTTTSIEETVAMAATMCPSRFAFFGYAHVPWMKKHMKAMDMDALPNNSLRYDLYQAGKSALNQAGYLQVGIDHFVQQSDAMYAAHQSAKLKRNFQGYTTDDAAYLIGLGASAISDTPYGYCQNIANIDEYQARIASHTFATQRGLVRSQEDTWRGELIAELMCYQNADLADYRAKYDGAKNGCNYALERLQPLIEDEMMQLVGSHIQVLPKAVLITRLVASAFDAYTPWMGQGVTKRHAQVV